MATATPTRPAKGKAPKRFKSEYGDISLEYIRKACSVAKLFGLEHLSGQFPSLNEKVPVRVYLIEGTDVLFDHPLVPEIDNDYVFDIWDLSVLLPYFIEGKGFPPYVYGLHGTGKSSIIEQIHARLGLPKVHVILGEDSEVIDLGGSMLPTEAGGMRFFDGLLVQSMRAGHTLQIDEYDLLPTRQQKMLNEVLENRRFTIEVTGEQVKAHPDWRVCVTANTNNTGASAIFASKGAGDASVNERFQFIEKDYMDEDLEIALLQSKARKLLEKHPKVIKKPELLDKLMVGMTELISQMYKTCSNIRKAYINSMKSQSNGSIALGCTMSTRALIEWLRSAIHLSVFFEGASHEVITTLTKKSFLISYANGIPEEDKHDVMHIMSTTIGI